MRTLLATFFTVFLLAFSTKPAIADVKTIELSDCVVVSHCVLENWEVNDVKVSFTKVVEAVTKTPRTKIVEQTDSFIHAEAKTRWRRFTDDLLVQALPERGVLQVRSESRVGVGDNGVNKKRVDDLAYRLMTNQIDY